MEPLLFEGEPHYPLTQLRQVYSDGRRTLWYQTELGHPGQRVCLETVELALAGQPEIYARVALQLQRPEGRQGLMLHPFCRLRCQLRGEFLPRHSRRVFALVVVD